MILKSLLIFALLNITIFAQWVNDPRENTPLVINPNDPTNIIVLSESTGNGFIIWQDLVSLKEHNIFFLHFNQNGQISFPSGGKAVSLSQFNKINPVAVISPADEVIILWKEIISTERQSLSIQKVNSLGARLWGDFGIQLERVEGDILDFSLSSNSLGETFVNLITRQLVQQKITKTFFRIGTKGNILSKNITYEKLQGNIHSSKIIAEDNNSAGLFWLETLNNKTILNFNLLRFDNKGSKTPITISNIKEDVLDFSASKIGNDYYIIWTVLTKNKRIYHQLISSNGTLKWGAEGKLLTTLKGSNYNPKHAFFNNKIIVSWVNENNKDKNIFAEAFDLKGEKLWDKKPLPIINIQGDQFGQQIVSDNKGGFIIAWLDRRNAEEFGNIYAQKITIDKKFLWDSTGVDLGTSYKSQKSYLNLISDKSGGAIAVFKDKRKEGCDIYGQKIFSTGTYAGQILGLKSELIGDSIKISWFTANESDIVEYDILRKNENESGWTRIANLKKISSKPVNYYEYFDFPDYNGIISYKIIKKIDGKEQQHSDITSVNYISDFSNFVLFQNSPNPFSKKTSISFSIPYREKVIIEIFDLQLTPLHVLVNDYFSEGKHTITFNAESLDSGIYFYRMKAGDFITVKKMVVNK